VAPRKKTLAEHVADGTFLGRRQAHRDLLEHDDLVEDPDQRKEQIRYRRLKTEGKRRESARSFERLVRGGGQARKEQEVDALAELVDELGGPGEEHRAERIIRIFPRCFRLEDGSPWLLDDWQAEFVWDAHQVRRDDVGVVRRVYKDILLGISRGLAKTPLATGHGVEGLICPPSGVTPRIFQVAGSKDQAKIGIDYAAAWVEGEEDAPGVLAPHVKARSERLFRSRGTYQILSSDGRLGHGRKPTVGIVDEWWLFESARERQAHVALESALAKVPESYLLQITTAGYDKGSQLGQAYESAWRLSHVEHHNDGFLRIARDPDAGRLVYWYGLPEGYVLDVEDDEAVRRAISLANPGTWVDHDGIFRAFLRARSKGDLSEWLRLALNTWTASRESWLPAGCFAALRHDEPIPKGAEIFVAVDAALHKDTTGVVWAALMPDGRILLQGRAWAARKDAPAHVLHAGGRIRNRDVMEWIHRELGGHYKIREIVADDRFFDDYLWELGQLGYLTAAWSQQSREMRDAEQHFYEAATSGSIAWHDPNDIFPRHLEATSAVATRYGFKVDNPHKSRPIDLATAAIMARERCAKDSREPDQPILLGFV
jgi:phage terminase large subunit-like protein